MKTPREILLARHRAAEPKLDAIREASVAAIRDQRRSAIDEERTQFTATIFQTVWRELFFPSRRIWAGLTAIWILILAVNFSDRDTVSSVTGKPVHAPATTMTWQMQQRWMNELFADRTPAPDADRPKIISPKPRTERFEAMNA